MGAKLEFGDFDECYSVQDIFSCNERIFAIAHALGSAYIHVCRLNGYTYLGGLYVAHVDMTKKMQD